MQLVLGRVNFVAFMVDSALASRLAQLNQAKLLVESDASYFPQIVVGVLPVFTDASVDLRRWVADFALTAFSSPKLPLVDKHDLSLKVIEPLSSAIVTEKDIATCKSYAQIAAIIYPMLFRHVYAAVYGLELY